MKISLSILSLLIVQSFKVLAQCPTFTINGVNGYTLNCTIASLNLNAVNTSTVSAPYAYSWSGPGIVSGSSSPTITVNTAGNYTLLVTNVVSACTSTFTCLVYQNYNVPSGTILTGNPINCINPSTSFTAYASPSGVSISWYNSSNVYQGVTGSSPSVFTTTMAGTYVAKLTNTVNGCFNQVSASVSSNTIAPNVNVTGTTTVCLGSSTTLFATGAQTYSWSTNAITNSINIIPVTTTTYNVIGTNTANGCSNMATLTVTVNPNCSDVWPGDANSDGVCDNVDVLELGLHSGQTGIPRTVAGGNWSSYFASNWTGTVSTGKNVAHSDCNGDGIINLNDLAPISANYSFTHSFKVVTVNSNTVDLSIVPDQAALPPGIWGTASIFAGSLTNSINNLYGVAFEATYDNTLIQTDSVYIVYANSFLNSGCVNFDFDKRSFSNGVNYAATVRTNQTAVNGNGKIATLFYKIKNSVPNNTILNIGITNAKKNSASGALSLLTSDTGTININSLATSVSVIKNNEDVVYLYPNPSTGIFKVKNNNTKFTEIRIYNGYGHLIWEALGVKENTEIDLNNFGKGIYISVIRVNNSSRSIKLLVE
ncbi:MAG: hypothetical protein JWO32_2510 [Bacteroidetes bacterium]|nr:hypothetical protein [Bacteroidota bacterium]